MPKNRIRDKGREPLILYPEKSVVNRREHQSKTPDMDNPYSLMVNVSTDRQTTASLPGEVDVKVIKVMAPFETPVGSWARAAFRGELWDIAIPPTISNFTTSTRHVEFTLRSRNEVAP